MQHTLNMTERRSWDFTPKPNYIHSTGNNEEFIPRVPFKFRKAPFVENKYFVLELKLKNV